MAIFEIEKDGKTFEVDAPDQNAALSAVGQTQPQRQSTTVPFVPGYDRVQGMIAQRPNPVEQFMKQVSAPKTPMGVVGDTAINMIGMSNPMLSMVSANRLGQVGGIGRQLAEAGIANTGMTLQAGQPQQAFQEFVKGVSGQKMGQYGDIIRGIAPKGKEWAYEPLAVVTGTLAALGQDTAMTKGFASKAVSDTYRQSRSRLMTPKWLKEKAVAVKNSVDKTMSRFRGIYGGLLGEGKPVADLSAIPKDIIKEFNLGSNPTTKAIWDARTQLLSDIADNAWENPTYYKHVRGNAQYLKDATQKMKAVVLNNVDKSTRDKIIEIDPQFGKAITKGRALVKMVYNAKTGEYKAKPLIRAIKDPEAIDSKGAFDAFKEFGDDLNRVESDIKKYISRQRTKQFAKKVLPWAAGLVGGGGVLSKILNAER